MAIVQTRRSFLAGLTALGGLGAAGLSARLIPLPAPLPAAAAREGAGPLVLRAAPGATARLLGGDAPATPVWTYNGRLPGPPITARQGDEVHVRLENGLDQPTTLHWHGVRLDNAMDGVPGLTQEPVKPGESFDYRFRVPDAGIFWYHPHELASEQIGRGLYGPLIVAEPAPPAVDLDLLVVIDDWRLNEDGTIHDSFGDLRDAAHAGRLGNVLTVNAQDTFAIHGRARERLRLRLFNVANARTVALRFDGHAPLLAALDGQPVAPAPTAGATVLLAAGQRADLFMDLTHLPGTKTPIAAIVGDREIEIGRILYHAYDLAHEAPLPPVAPLPANLPAGAPSLSGVRRVEIAMRGGAMGRLEGGIFEGARYDARGLVERGQAWTLNGVAGRPAEPLFAASLGEPVVLAFRNDTPWPHGMHLHGHHFREVGPDGRVSPVWRDTVLVDADERRPVLLVADNPGKWLIHCHMLEHHAAGMVTWFAVNR
jgi:FtsP/CotA-like multicopper oxidase with cupredoxin domain